MYSMVRAYPDTAYLLPQISQFIVTSNSTHETAAKRSLRYLIETADVGITYDEKDRLVICRSILQCRLYSSEMIIIMANNAVSRQSKKQSTVATSTTEAEYVAITNTAKELI